MTAGRRVLLLVAASALLVQSLSARFFVRNFETPNVSTLIAHNLVDTGTFTVPGWMDHPRAYVLPGEPLFLAAVFRALPPASWRYAHVPVTACLVTAIAAVALALFGPGPALVAGGLAVFDPFIAGHGPVWDDTFLAAALEWGILAVLVREITRDRSAGATRVRPATWALVFLSAGVAALTRSDAQVLLVAVGAGIALAPRLRGIRSLGVALILGVAVALGAWGVRNTVVLGQFIVGTSHDGKTLFESNGRTALDSIRRTGMAQVFIAGQLPAVMVQAGTRGEIDGDRTLARAAVAGMTAHPLETLQTSSVKVVLSLLGWNASRSVMSPRNLVLISANLLLFVFAGAGWRRGRRDRLGGGALWRLWTSSCVVVTIFVLMFGPVGARYRVIVNGVLYVSAAVALRRLVPNTPPDDSR